jgi:hypothetical protein
MSTTHNIIAAIVYTKVITADDSRINNRICAIIGPTTVKTTCLFFQELYY